MNDRAWSDPGPDEVFAWKFPHDGFADTMAILTCALSQDIDQAADIFKSLTRGQLLTICWTLARMLRANARCLRSPSTTYPKRYDVVP